MVGDSNQGIQAPVLSGIVGGPCKVMLDFILSPVSPISCHVPPLFPHVVVLQPWQAPEPPGGLVETRIAGPYPQSF